MSACGEDATLIGLIDGPIKRNTHASCDLTNKVGGAPDVTPGVAWPRPVCALCGTPLVHVLQVHCPLHASPYYRTLHVLACCRGACGGRAESWVALRSQRLVRDEVTPPSVSVPMATTAWCDGADDWGGEAGEGGGSPPEEEEEEEEEEDTAKELEAAVHELSLTGQVNDQQGAPADVLQSFYISVVEEEDLGGDDGLSHAQRLLQEYEDREGAAAGCADSAPGGQGEMYEKMSARHGDGVFWRFMKRIGRCPEQVLRYRRGGEPLLLCAPPGGALPHAPPCSACGGGRTFEFQLMPALVNALRRAGSDPEPALEFGTVLVYTCRGSCWAGGVTSPREEFVLVQGDPDQPLFTS